MADILKPGTVDSGFKFIGGDPSSPTSWEPESLKIGTLDEGYRFKGGDPSDEKSWEKAPERSYLGASAVSGGRTLLAAGAKLLEEFNPFTTSEQDAAVLYKDNPEKLKEFTEKSASATLSRFAQEQTRRAREAMEEVKPGEKGLISGQQLDQLEYATLDPEKAAYLSPTRVAGDVLQSLPTTLALATSAYLTKGRSLAAYERAEAAAIARGVTAEEAKQVAKTEALKVAADTMAKTGAVGEGAIGYAQQANQTLDEIKRMPEAEWEKSTEYKKLLDEGFAPESAKTLLSARAAEQAGATAGAVDAATNLIGGKVLGRVIGEGGSLAARTAKGFGTEAATETVQSAGEQLGANVAMQRITPDLDLTKGVLESAVAGGVVGGVTGGGTAAIFGSRQRPETQVLDDLNKAPTVDAAVNAANELAGSVDTLAAATTAYLAPETTAPALTPNETLELAAAKGAIQRTPSLDLGAGPAVIAPAGETQAAADTALRAVEAAGGVATPAQAAIIDAAFPGRKMYDSVALGGAAAAPTGGTIEVPKVTVPRETFVQGATEAANAEGFAELQARQQAAAAPAAAAPVAPAPPAANTVIAAFATPAVQRTSEQRITLNSAAQAYSPEDVETMQLAATAPFKLDASQKLRLQTMRQEAGPQLSPARVMEALAVTPVMRTPEQQAAVTQARDNMSGEDFEILRVGAVDPSMLEPAQVPRFEELSRQFAAPLPVAGASAAPQTPTPTAAPGLATPEFVAQMASTPERPFTSADVVVVDVDTLQGVEKQNFRLINQISRVFGKQVVVFDGLAGMGADGFVNPQDTNKIFLNRNSQMPHIAVFGHEMLHLLRRDSPDAYNAFASIVSKNLDEEGRAAFKAEYGETGEALEEISADLMGNRFRDAGFWTETFNEIAAQQGAPQARSVITKLAGALYTAVDKAIAALRGQGFRADTYVKDLNQIKAAAKAALKTYAEQRRIPAMQMELEVAKASKAMDTVSRANIGEQNAKPIQSVARANRPELAGDRGDREALDAGYGTAREGAVQVQGVHYSKQQRQQLNSEFSGTGLKGEEAQRLAKAADARIRQRIYFYVDTGKGIKPEEGVGAYAHTAKLNNIYDPASRIIGKQADENAFETAVIDAGFDGYLNRAFGAVVLLDRRAVPVAPYQGNAEQVKEPVPSKAAPAAARLAGMRSLPAGELSRERWGQVLKTVAPELHAELEPTGAFRGEERVYKDQLGPKLSTKRATPQDAAKLENAFAFARENAFGTNRQLKVAIQEAVREAAGKRDLAADEKYLVDIGVEDALYALQSNANAVGWYDKTVTKALDVLATLHPEIATDPNAKFAFTWALAVTSNGLKVDKNFELAERAYRFYKDNGNMPTNIQAGQAQKAINDSLGLFNQLVSDYGIDTVRKFMSDKFTVGQIERVTGIGVGGEFKDTEVRGAAILGPKIGNGFFSNLNGFFDQLTMDRWLMRTWGRWTGTLIEDRPDMVRQKREELQGLIREIKKNAPAALAFEKALGRKLTLGNPDEVAAAIQKVSMKPATRTEFNKTQVGENIRKTGNGLAKYLDGQKEAPDGPAERNQIRKVFSGILEAVRKQGYQDLTMSDLQALLWYPEKRLYDTAKSSETSEGYADDEAPDYANAAAKLARDNGVSNTEIENATNVSARRAERNLGNDEAEARAEGGVRGFSEQERKAFLLRGILRPYRVSNAATQPYTRTSDRGAGGVRVLGQDAVAEYTPSRKFKNALASVDVPAPKLFELGPDGAALFTDSIKAAKDSSAYGAAVYVYPEADYRDMRLFITDDGKSGFALKGDDIVSVFSGIKGSSTAMLRLAVQEGGRRLDAFDTALPDIYANNGFRVVARLPWNDEYRPADWNKAVFSRYNNGEPDVVFMAYDPAKADAFGGKEVADYDEGNAEQQKALQKEQPVLSRRRGLESIFEGLNGRGLALTRAQAAADAHPAATQIAYVQDNFYDILAQLEESGQVEINCD